MVKSTVSPLKENLSLKIPEEFATKYSDEILRLNVSSAQFVTLLAPVLFLLFFFTGIDYLFYPQGLTEFLVIRIVVSFVMLFLHTLTYQKKFEKLCIYLSSLTLIIGGLGIAIMIRKIGYESPYYAGLNLAYLGTLLLPYSILGSLITCLPIYLFYLLPILMFDFDTLNLKLFISNNQFQLFTIAIVCSINYMKYRNTKMLLLNKLTIQKQSDELTNQENEKRQFIANISHDLKTPLSIISGHVDFIRPSFSCGAVELKYLDYIDNSILQINRLLDMLISITLLNRKEEKPSIELYDYPLFVKSFCDHFKVQGQNHGISFATEIMDEKIVVGSDNIWLERILGNLIQNSFKFTVPGQSIKIKVYRDNEFIHTEVIDTGSGIPEEKLNHIFERKYQADAEKSHLGYGLGLAIVKEMVSRLGGTIDAHSKLGEGTTMHFCLPVHCDQFAPVKNGPYEQTERRSGVDRRQNSRVKFIQEQIEHNSLISKITIDITQFENIDPTLRSILICEDNHGQLHLLIQALKDSFNLIIAENGKQGLLKLDLYGSKINLIISDVRMPEMDGLEFCKQVLTNEKYKQCPFIFLTSYTDEKEQLTGLSYGATDYLQKPFNKAILIEKINHWLSRREHEQILANLVTSLEIKNQEVSQLRSIITHEIRNPLMILNSIHYSLTKLKNHFFDLSNEKEKNYWDSLNNIFRVINSINGVLDSAKIIENGIISTSIQKEQISTILENAIEETAHLRSSVKLQINNPYDQYEYVLCDQLLLTQVFVNLIRNAIEAIAEGGVENGVITIEIAKNDNCFNFYISDNGAGIPQERINNLFQYHYTTKQDGTGIGLYFSKRILKVHGGDITVESQSGKGTVFTISLPIGNTPSKQQNFDTTKIKI